MLSPDYYESCADDVLRLYEQLEDDIISDVIRRIMKTGIVTETAKHQLEQLQEVGLLYDDILNIIAGQTDATTQHVRTLFEDAGVETVQIDNKIYRENGLTPVDIQQSPAMRQTLEAGYRKTLGNMKNLTLTTANTSQSAYINACNQAYMQVTSGAFSYQEAIKQAIQRTAQNGATVLYPSGHTEHIDVAVRRAVLTGIGQTCREIGIMNAEESGCDLMEISAHSGARPSHASWQGKIVSLSGRKGYLSKSDIGYGTGDGFGGWNCRHDWFPFFEGYSKPNYSKKDLEKLDERNIEYNGKLYNQYEISQIQRRYEREIRSAKREQVAFKVAVEEATDPKLKQVMQDSLNYSNSLVRDKQAKMRDFIRQTGQNRDYFREQNYPKENRSVNQNTSLTPDNKKIKDSIRHTEYQWDSKTNLEKAKENVQKHPLIERIQSVREKIRDNGVQEKYIHEAGKAMFEELMVIYNESNRNKELYGILTKNLNDQMKKGIVDMELFHRLENMPVIENHALTLKNILSTIRKVGYDQNAINNHLIERDKTSFEIVAQAYQYLPEDWIKSSLQKGKIVVQYEERGMYQNNINTLSTNATLRNSIHELVHRMEYTHQGLLQAEKVFYKRRTANEELMKLSDIYPDLDYEDSEITRKDKFINAYMGKDYKGNAYELLTMGLELLYSEPEKMWKDKDMTTWLYGVLMLL